MRFLRLPTDLPDITPQASSLIISGSMDHPVSTVVRVSSAFVATEADGYGMDHVQARGQAVWQLLNALHAVSKEAVANINPLIGGFAIGNIQYTGRQEETYSILHGHIRALRDWHNLQASHYDHVQLEYESQLEWMTAGWGDAAARESLECDFAKIEEQRIYHANCEWALGYLADATMLYPKGDGNNSLSKRYETLVDMSHILIVDYR